MLRYIFFDTDFRVLEVRELERLLDGLVDRDLAYMRERLAAGLPVPTLAEAGITCVPTYDENRDIVAMIARGCGDVDDLACWRAAELRLTGIEAGVEVVSYERDGHTCYTCRVRRADGVVEDLEKLVRGGEL